MTVLLTSDGQRLTSGGPFQQLQSGRNAIARSSVPFELYGSDNVTLLGDGRTISFARLYRTQPWVAAAVNKLSRQIARLPLKVYEIDSQGDRRRVRDHPLARLVKTPFPRASALDLKYASAFPLLLNGNGLLRKVRASAGGPVIELRPVDIRYSIPRAAFQGGPIEYWETKVDGERVFLAAEDTIHFAWGAPDSPLGVSPLQQLGVTVGLEEAAQRYGQSSLRKGGRPGALLVNPEAKNIDPEEKRQVLSALNSDTDETGWGIGMLTGGWELRSWSHSAKEAELIEQRKIGREEVAAVYDVPPPLLGILDHATYSNIEELHSQFYKTILGTWLSLLSETFQAQLIKGESAFEGVFLEFDPSELLKGDPKERAEAYKNFIQAGVYTINEVRQIENLPRIDLPICDEPLVPVNNLAPASQAPDAFSLRSAFRMNGQGITPEAMTLVEQTLADIASQSDN